MAQPAANSAPISKMRCWSCPDITTKLASKATYSSAARAVVPKPVQTPHPPLWLGGGKRETARVAGEGGLGALVLAPTDPEAVRDWVDEYYEALSDCVPLGFAVHAAFALALPMMVHADEAEAIARGLDGAHFDAYARGHYESFGRHRPGRTSVWEEFEARRDDVGLVCFDDFALAALMPRPLLCVSYSVRELGELAAEQLFRRIEGDTSAPQHVVVPTRVIERGIRADALAERSASSPASPASPASPDEGTPR